MPLFMPQDPPDSLGEFKPLGPAKKLDVKEVPVTLEKTGTPGIVRNSQTGKLQTDLPEPQQKLVPLQEPDQKSCEELATDYKRMFQEDIETSVLGYPREYLNQELPRNFLEGTCTVSTPRREGKSLITEMYKKYAALNPSSRIVLKDRLDMLVLNDLTEDNRDDWMKWIK